MTAIPSITFPARLAALVYIRINLPETASHPEGLPDIFKVMPSETTQRIWNEVRGVTLEGRPATRIIAESVSEMGLFCAERINNYAVFPLAVFDDVERGNDTAERGLSALKDCREDLQALGDLLAFVAWSARKTADPDFLEGFHRRIGREVVGHLEVLIGMALWAFGMDPATE